MKRKILFLLTVIVLGTLVLAGCTSKTSAPNSSNTSSSSTSGNTTRELAPDFSWKDTNGNVIKLSVLKGKVVLIDFWATWCGPCKMTIPHVEALYETYRDKNVIVLGISVDDPSTAANIPSFIEQNGMKYLVVSDSNGTVSSLYGVSSIPRFFIIDKNGRVAKTITGYDTKMEKIISDEIDKLLQE
jgi:peroxiredoxin